MGGRRPATPLSRASPANSQGLLVHDDGFIYESTGLYGGRSKLRKLDPVTFKVLKEATLPAKFFGEGIVIWKDRIIFLTWREKTAFIYDVETFALVDTKAFVTPTGEGWGITHDGTHLIVSDGSQWLVFWDPVTLEEVRRVVVHTEGGHAVQHINELEFVGGSVLANVWYKDEIARIDPATGLITAWYSLRGVLPRSKRNGHEDCLNGIAVVGGPAVAFDDTADISSVELYVAGDMSSVRGTRVCVCVCRWGQ